MAADRAAKKEHGCHQEHAFRRLSPQAKASQLSARKSGTRSVRCPCLGWPLAGNSKSGKGPGADPVFSEHPIIVRHNQNATNPAQPPATGGNLPPEEIKE